jgi:hypothetical protein
MRKIKTISKKILASFLTIVILSTFIVSVSAGEAIAVDPEQGGAGIITALQTGNVILSAGIYYCSSDIVVPDGRNITGVHDPDDPRNPQKNSILYFESRGCISPKGNNTLSRFSILGAGYVYMINASNIKCEDIYITHQDLNGNSQPSAYLPAAFHCLAEDNDISNIRYNCCIAEHVNGHGWQNDSNSDNHYWIRGLTITNCRASYTGEAFLLSGGEDGWPWDGSGFTFQERCKLEDAYIANCIAEYTLISGFHQEAAGMFGGFSGAKNIILENCKSYYSGTKGSMPENPYGCGDDRSNGEWWTFGGFTIAANAIVRDCEAHYGWMNFMGWWSQNVKVERFLSYGSISAGYLLPVESGCNISNTFTDCVSENDGKCALNLYAGSNNTFTNFTVKDCQATSGWQILANGCTDAGYWGDLYAYPYTNNVNCHIIGGGLKIAKCYNETNGSKLILSGDATGEYAENPFSGAVDHSGFSITPTLPDETTIVNDAIMGTSNNQFEYVGTWGHDTEPEAYNDDNSYSCTPDDYYQVRFTGIQIAIYASKAPNHGKVAISIDNGPETIVDLYYPVKVHQTNYYTSQMLEYGEHILKVRVTGTKNDDSTDYFITADRVEITSAAPDLVITDILSEPANPAVGDEVIFKATIKNQGNAATPDDVIHGIAFFVDGDVASWSDGHMSSIAPGESVTVTANGGPEGSAAWTATAGIHTVRAWVDDVDRIKEQDEENNTYEKDILVTGPPSITLTAEQKILCSGGTTTLALTGKSTDGQTVDLDSTEIEYILSSQDIASIEADGTSAVLRIAEDIGDIRELEIWADVTIDEMSLQSNKLRIYLHTPGEPVLVNDNDPDINFSLGWTYQHDAPYGDYKSDTHWTIDPDAYFEYTFTGTGIDYITQNDDIMGDVDIYIDGEFQETVSCYDEELLVQQVVYSITGLVPGEHTIKVINKGYCAVLDAFRIYTDTSATPTPDLNVGDVKFTDLNGTEIASLIGGTDIKAAAQITNNTDREIPAIIIIALYDKNDRIVNYSAASQQIGNNAVITLEAGFKLPVNVEEHKIKIFVWNSWEGMKPLSNAVIFP